MTEPRIALVTGASRGIGRAVALALARDGWRVICAARAQKALEQLDDEIRALGKGEATLVPLDLRDGDAIDRLGAALFERYGKLDALAACAGVLGALTPAHQATPAVMEETMAVNFIANHRLLRVLHPLLRAADAGRAVFVLLRRRTRPARLLGPLRRQQSRARSLHHQLRRRKRNHADQRQPLQSRPHPHRHARPRFPRRRPDDAAHAGRSCAGDRRAAASRVHAQRRTCALRQKLGGAE
ncbi:MAG: SDR family NAD(P)-dependent oxidoreductase [Terricaulis sp.]